MYPIFKWLPVIIAGLFSWNAMAQEKYQDSTGTWIWKGPVTLEALQTEPSFTWLTTFGNTYQPDTLKLDSLKSLLQEVEVKIYMGTWCEDTHLLFSQWVRLLAIAGVSPRKMSITALDRQKQSTDNSPAVDGIRHIPAFIFYREGKEIGRIVESVYPDLETALLQVLRH